MGTYVTSANGSFTVTGLKKGYYICESWRVTAAIIDAARSFYLSGETRTL